MRKLPSALICAASSCALFVDLAAAQAPAGNYPSRPVTMIVPYGSGGLADTIARLHAGKLSEAQHQQFIIDYKPGGGTLVGTNFVAKAPADGYTLLVASGSHTISPWLYKDIPYDNIKDFAPIALLGKYPQVYVVPSTFPVKTLMEYITYAKANPGKVNYGTGGAGNVSHLAGERMHRATNTTVTFVHYKTFGSLMTDLVSGRVDITANSPQGVLPQIKAGKLRVLAVTSNVRTKLLPETPTVEEAIGVSDFDVANWIGYMAPAATPAAIVNRLADSLAAIAKMPDVVANAESVGGVPLYDGPAQFRQYLVKENDQWKKLITESGIKLEE